MVKPRFHAFLPTNHDSRGLHPGDRDFRPATSDYLIDVARSAERNGFESILIPTGSRSLDAWMLAPAIAQHTKTLRFLIASRVGFVLPVLFAQQVETFVRMYGDRLDLNVVTGGNPSEQQAYGDFLSKDERYLRTAEFLDVLKAAWAAEPVNYRGHYYSVNGAVLDKPLERQPALFFSGASEAAENISAHHADVQLMFGETPPMVRERVQRLRDLSARKGRDISFGIRLHCIVRPTEEEAWDVAKRLFEGADSELAKAKLARLLASEATGLQRIAGLLNGSLSSPDSLVLYPNLWAGSAIFNTNPALVGSYENVAARIAEYTEAGIEHFILSGYPKLEEYYWLGEGVLPLFQTAVLRNQEIPDLRKGQL